MAKTVDTKAKEKKAKTPDFKDTLYGITGQAIADTLDNEIYRIKVEGMPECIIVTENGIDYTISITQKKSNVEYDTDHIRATFAPKEEDAGEDEGSNDEA